MNSDERLTNAARLGAQGKTATAYNSLPDGMKQSLLEHVMGDSKLTEEIVRTTLNAASQAEIEDMLNELGDGSAKANAKDAGQTFHTNSAKSEA